MTIAALFSGLVAGAAVGVFGLGIFGPLLVTVPNTSRLRRFAPDPATWVMVSLAFSFAAQGGSAVLGLALGAAFLSVADDAASGLGSPSWVFTAAMLAAVGGLAAAAVALWPHRARRIGIMSLLAAGAYGWMLPHLASA